MGKCFAHSDFFPAPACGDLSPMLSQDPVDFYGHSGGASNLGFVDGHAESQVKLKPQDWNKE